MQMLSGELYSITGATGVIHVGDVAEPRRVGARHWLEILPLLAAVIGGLSLVAAALGVLSTPIGIAASALLGAIASAIAIRRYRHWQRHHPIGSRTMRLRKRARQLHDVARIYFQHRRHYDEVRELVKLGTYPEPQDANAYFAFLKRAHRTLTAELRLIELESRCLQSGKLAAEPPSLASALADIDSTIAAAPEPTINFTEEVRDDTAMQRLEQELRQAQLT